MTVGQIDSPPSWEAMSRVRRMMTQSREIERERETNREFLLDNEGREIGRTYLDVPFLLEGR